MCSSRHLIGDAGLGQPDELSEWGIRSLRLDTATLMRVAVSLGLLRRLKSMPQSSSASGALR